jgi:hypothetical protein
LRSDSERLFFHCFRKQAWESRNSRMKKSTIWLTWFLLLFLISFGLGYPVLNRYSPPSTPGLSDSLQYFRLVEDGPHAAFGHWRYRVLVPFLAKPIYWVARRRLGTWNPISFALLIVNSGFCAASAALLSRLTLRIRQDSLIPAIAAFAYLLNFAVANYQLSGLVDSAEAFCFLVLTWALMTRTWLVLPLVGLLAGLSKETFVPIAFVFAMVWIFSERNDRRGRAVVAILTMTMVSLVTVLLVRSAIDGALVTPWQIVAEERSISEGMARNGLGIFVNWTFWLTLMWVPFLVPTWQSLPKSWRYAAIAGAVAALVLAIWNDAGGGNTARPLFNVLGPILALAFALAVETAKRFVAPSHDSAQ